MQAVGIREAPVRTRHLSVTAFVAAVLCVCGTAGAWSMLRNYDNDPDLAAAMRYDSEVNKGATREGASQSLAEKHYLAYLTRAKDPDQRARVYVQLGVLFSTNWNKEAGESPDYAKAREYFQHALREAPESVGCPMLRARLGLATPLQTAEECLAIRLDAYRWIESIDEKKIAEKWLRSRPGEKPIDDHIRSEMEVLRNIQLAVISGIIGDARHTQDPDASLRKIADTFPNSKLSEAALEALKPKLERGRETGSHRAAS